jgi:L-alanine-DL-glutamate epimerase-like enolase superfamily enzyme
MNRRTFLAGAVATGAAAQARGNPLFATRRPDGLYAFGPREPLLALERVSASAVTIERLDVVELTPESNLLRVVATDGAFGVTACSPNKWAELRPLVERLVKPFLVGRDARRLEQHLWDYSRRQYEYAGAPMWNAWGHAECAVFDLLGQVSGKPVAELLGGVRRTEIPFYISSNRRGGDPAAEVDALRAALASSGCTGVKIKIGGRMNRNRDAADGWTPGIVSATRKGLGDAVTIYADANGGYDAPTALEVARLLEDHGVTMWEEPCPGDDIDMTGQVTQRLRRRRSKLLIGAGENEGNATVWRHWIDGRHLDVAQPDPHYGGGLIHCIAVARMTAAAGLRFNPHWPREGAEQAPLMHLCAAAPKLWGLQEYRLRPRAHPYGPISTYELKEGVMKLPDAAGFGVQYDSALWARAVAL